MSKENKVNCILGNGECPKTCPNHEISKAISEKLGNNFDPFLSRVRVVFGDAFNEDIGVFDVTATIDKCIKEKKPKKTRPR